jgi:hypothetical protein
MNKGFIFIPGIVFLALSLFSGCGTGPVGPTGPQGKTGTGTPVFQAEFEEEAYPDSGYAGVDTHWLDGSNPNTSPGTGEVEVATGTTTGNVALGLVSFNLSYGIPSNATIAAATLQLTTQTSTNLSAGNYMFGLHQIIPPPAGQVVWNNSSTWNLLVNPYGWNGGSNSPITAGVDYQATPMDAVTVTSAQVNSNQVLLAWNITPSLAQVWVNSSNNNYGVLISPEPETNTSLSGFIAFWDNTGSNQQKPKMLVNYTIP